MITLQKFKETAMDIGVLRYQHEIRAILSKEFTLEIARTENEKDVTVISLKRIELYKQRRLS